jgi:hypothetical protein
MLTTSVEVRHARKATPETRFCERLDSRPTVFIGDEPYQFAPADEHGRGPIRGSEGS